MPVSSPTEFPPASSGHSIVGATAGKGATGLRTFLAGFTAGQFTQTGAGGDDLIIIGASAFSAGTAVAPINDANLTGTIIVGSQAAKLVTSTQNFGAGVSGPSTIVGFQALAAATDCNLSTVIGSNAAASYPSGTNGQRFGGNVVIGESAMPNLTIANPGSGDGVNQAVIIGSQAAGNLNNPTSMSFKASVVIGWRAASGAIHSANTGGVGIERCVILGSQAGSSLGNTDSANGSNDNVFIGFGAGAAAVSRGNVLIGSGATGTGPGLTCTNNIGIGSTLTGGSGVTTGADRNIVIGTDANQGGTGSRCIVIGCGANPANGNTNDQFLVETNDTLTRRTLLYGIMCDGATNGTGFVVGFSSAGVNRDIPGKNILKLIDGSYTAVAPVGGGIFYSSAGRLHWVDTAGVDWTLTGTASGQLASTVNAYTNNAAAAAGTLTNAPVAGNPTKWIPINDNGTIRNIPAW